MISTLEKKIEEPKISNNEKEILKIIESGNQSLVEEAREYFQSEESDTCPYCLQKVTEDYKAQLLLEIAKVFNSVRQSSAKKYLILLDEPTSLLNDEEIQKFMDRILHGIRTIIGGEIRG